MQILIILSSFLIAPSVHVYVVVKHLIQVKIKFFVS